MARPRKYHTPEERLAANRAKSNRHYKLNKATIIAKRRPKRTILSILQGGKAEESTSALSCWIARAERASTQYERFVDNQPPAYLERLCKSYIATQQINIIRDAIAAVTLILADVRTCENNILQLVGVDHRWRQVQNSATRISRVIGYMEELECLAMGDPAELVSLYTSKRLMYQI
ncbi:hypothetical protein BD779DRAFT_1678460 [Infundibulicybe gibba]|nr:hypothetical protein BD779DRAFT_1678460 [Infundibulicybe gibba]